MIWKIAEAKNKFSEVFDRAIDGEPQRVTRRGQSVIVLDECEYLLLKGAKKNFIEQLRSGPDIHELEQPPRRPLKIQPID